MKELILNFNNISAKESLDALGGETLNSTIAYIVSILIALGVAYAIYEKGKLVRSIVAGVGAFVGIFFLIASGMFAAGDVKAKENRLKEIIEVANEEGLYEDLIIDDEVIMYDDIACKHKIRNINSLIRKNDDGKYVFIEN